MSSKIVISEGSFRHLTSLLVTLGNRPSRSLLYSLKANNQIFNYTKRTGMIRVQPTPSLWWLEKLPRQSWAIKGVV